MILLKKNPANPVNPVRKRPHRNTPNVFQKGIPKMFLYQKTVRTHAKILYIPGIFVKEKGRAH